MVGSNGQGGIIINSSGNAILGNYVGTADDGSAPRGNAGNGIWITSGATANFIGNQIGGGNVISNNSSNGILVSDGPNFVYGNIVGMNSTQSASIGNSSNGISVTGGTGTQIGAAVSGAGNIIGGNNIGINVIVSGTSILGNFVGTDNTGTGSFPNFNHGI